MFKIKHHYLETAYADSCQWLHIKISMASFGHNSCKLNAVHHGITLFCCYKYQTLRQYVPAYFSMYIAVPLYVHLALTHTYKTVFVLKIIDAQSSLLYIFVLDRYKFRDCASHVRDESRSYYCIIKFNLTFKVLKLKTATHFIKSIFIQLFITINITCYLRPSCVLYYVAIFARSLKS